MLLNPAFLKLNKIPLLLVLTSLLFYWVFAFDLVRTDYTKLICLYTALFFLFYKLVQRLKNQIVFLTWLAFGFRAVFILAIPNLSQDFYRFIWDGRMIIEGFNPYLFTPESFISIAKFPIYQAQVLFDGMGALNASHFSNYPPINQLSFAIAALFAGKSILGSIIVMRLLLIAADFGTLYFGKKLLNKLNIPVYHIFWYILNPFIIIELTGNLHFEGVVIFFLIWSLYLLHCGKWVYAALALALSVSTKLIPLLFLPLFHQWFLKQNDYDDKKVPMASKLTVLISFYAIACFTTLLLFAPFYSTEFINNYAKTIGLWFRDFEFNASIYYIARHIGYSFRGYNEIGEIGKVIPVVVIIFILILTFFRKNNTTIQLITAMLFALSFYYFTATTVHPWYIATLLFLSVFTKYKFPLVWSGVIILSYLAYLNVNKEDASENLWILAVEYLVVYGVFIWEVFIKKATQKVA